LKYPDMEFRLCNAKPKWIPRGKEIKNSYPEFLPENFSIVSLRSFLGCGFVFVRYFISLKSTE